MVKKPTVIKFLIVMLFLSAILSPAPSFAAFSEMPATEYGDIIDAREIELAPGAMYSRVDLMDSNGQQNIHMVTFDPKNPQLELRAGKKAGKVYGMMGVTEMASQHDSPGSRVIAGVNGDFFDISGQATGLPNGLFMDQGNILTSPTGSFAFGLKEDGSSLYGRPALQRSVTIDGENVPLSHINRSRGNNQLVLYTTDYFTSTKTNSEGDEIILDVLEGSVQSGQTLILRVKDVRKSQGDTPLEEGTVVLSASGTAKESVTDLQIGDELSASFQFDGEWADVTLAIGGNGPLIKDGVAQDTGFNAGVHPRTAIGTKADGSIVLFEVDGRQPGVSEGMRTTELEQALLDHEVVDAMNLDGGGSSTFVARLPGTNDIRMLNQGSDGGERKTGNGLLLVNTAPELEQAEKLVVTPNAERVLQGSQYTFEALAVDANGHPASIGENVTWDVEEEAGTINAAGTFTAGDQPGYADINVSNGASSGSAEVEVVTAIDELKLPSESRSFNPGTEVQLQVTALREGQVIQATNDRFKWSIEGDIGTIDENGVFTAANGNDLRGEIVVNYGDVQTTMDVSIGQAPVIIEDFEEGIDQYVATGAEVNSIDVEEETNLDYVRNGSKSAKLSYDFIGKPGTSGVYLTPRSSHRPIPIEGYPQKISMWIYGDGNKHWLRAQMKDGNGAPFPINFTGSDAEGGVNWTGWRYVEAAVPAGKSLPLTLDLPVRLMETSGNKKDAGAIYVDDIRAVYGPTTDDVTPPVIKQISPAEDTVISNTTPTIQVTSEDEGYDPEKHPGTTLIDPDSIRVYIDDELVEHGFYPPDGTISYQPSAPLAERRYKVKVAVRDLEGNQTIKEWYFTVNIGSPFYTYETPEATYAGQTYTVDITAQNASSLKSGQLAFNINPEAIKSVRVIRGEKLSEEQLGTEILEKQVELSFQNLDQLNLTEADRLAQIEYTISNTYLGPFTLEQAEGDIAKEQVIAFASGSIVSTEGDGEPIDFIGPSLRTLVKPDLKLSWDPYATIMGESTAFTIEQAEDGTKLAGAKLLVNGEEVASDVSDEDGVLRTEAATQEAGTYQVQAVLNNAYSPLMTFTVSPYSGQATPKNINVTMGNEPETERRFAWQTSPETNETVVEFVKQSEFTSFDATNVKVVEGSSSLYTTYQDGTLRIHKAELADLEPGTAYVYRVGDGDQLVSEQGVFKTTEAAGDETSFLFLGDSQAGSAETFALWGNTLQEALDYMPEAEFLLHAGDMIDKSFEQKEWDWWFSAAQDQLMDTTLIPIVGNHEVNGSNGYGDYLAHFNNPENGAPGLKGTNFSFDIKDTHVVVLNTEGSANDYEKQAEWLDNDLAANDKKWTIIAFHQGPYGSTYANERVQSMWVPIFDKHEVDLVLTGHDHLYLRTYPMNGGEIVQEGEGTRYVIGGSSGPKFYGLTEKNYQEYVYAKEKQIFSAIHIQGDTLTLTAKAVDGEDVDQFSITKGEESGDPQVTITPSSATIEVGESVQLEASVTPETDPAPEFNWSIVSSSSDDVATVSESGLVKGMKAGEVTVRATSKEDENAFAESKITVVERQTGDIVSIEVKGETELEPNSTDQVIVEATYESGERMKVTEGVSFVSSDTEVATIDENGLVQAIQEGETDIAVEYEGLQDSYRLSIVSEESPDPEETGIKMHGPTLLNVGDTADIRVKVMYDNGTSEEVTENVLYESGDEAIATVSETGEVTALTEGETELTVTYEDFEEAIHLIVSTDAETILTGIELEGRQTLQVGETAELVVSGLYSNGDIEEVTDDLALASSDADIVEVTPDGTMTALREGTATISVSYQEFDAELEVNVKGAEEEVVIERIELTGLPSTMEVGETAAAQVTALYSDGSTASVLDETTFESSSSDIVSISPEGIVTANTEGQAIISAMFEEQMVQHEIVVWRDELPEPPEENEPGRPDDEDEDEDDRDDDDRENDDQTEVEEDSSDEAIDEEDGDQPQSTRPGQVNVNEEMFSNRTDNELVVTSEGTLEEVLIPSSLLEDLTKTTVIIEADGATISIPPAVFAQLSLDVNEEATVILLIQELAKEVVSENRIAIEGETGAQIVQAGSIEVAVGIQLSSGATSSIGTFPEPLIIEIPVAEGLDAKLTGLYEVGNNESLVYTGGQISEGTLTANIQHPGSYSVLEYTKSFADVNEAHWAHDMLQQMVAKQFVEGVSMDRFQPEDQVTRAEFTTMIVRFLDLKGNETTVFTDVSADEWFANDVALAYNAGLVNGVGKDHFMPHEEMTRQEMVAVLMRAYTLSHGTSLQTENTSQFNDIASSPAWAKEAIEKAEALGLVQGQSENQFNPLDQGTRAESAQLILNMYELLNQR
ncbi:Ig-like domain-containing protein [Aureibacillus halotolerans]|uniref:Ig-like protein group 2 n=1 Tax=Aureibacillus halotolerans TaxID=1508390 RepID=A0A4R6U8I1_9BACI|nr:Ig-like domain-containing protein [Aureibacillus halotolerans]TDQ42868.1 Ig-like protein group 2 [Aureibacillus halotolerans]